MSKIQTLNWSEVFCAMVPGIWEEAGTGRVPGSRRPGTCFRDGGPERDSEADTELDDDPADSTEVPEAQRVLTSNVRSK